MGEADSFRKLVGEYTQIKETYVESGPITGKKPKTRTPASLVRAQSASQRRRTLRNNAKHIGDLAEMDFMLQAASRGFPVAKPFGDNEHYDVMVDAGTRIWRVQVKTAAFYRNHAFAVRSHWSGYRHVAPYTPADIDFLAAFIRGLRIWYLIPAKEIRGRLTLNLYPLGARHSAARFEKYREAGCPTFRGFRKVGAHC